MLGSSLSRNRPEPTTTMPGMVTPHQNSPFSPALNRCDGTSCSPSMPPALLSHTKSALLAMLSFTKVTTMISSDTANNGPRKLCRFFSAKVSQPNSVLPITGKRKNLPKAMISPEMASATKAPALAQCAARSKGVKRSTLRPVSGT